MGMDNMPRTKSPKPNSAPKKSSNQSLTPSQQELARQIYLTAQNSKTETDDHINREFDREFSKRAPAAIRWVFEEWRRRSAFFPAVSDLFSLFHERESHIQAQSDRFTSCGNCDQDGWVRVFEGSWWSQGKQYQVNPKIGVVRRCHCWLNWVTAKKGKLAE
jgi:hypothetical protein